MKNFKQRKYNKMKKKAVETNDMDKFKQLVYKMDKMHKDDKIK